MLYLYVTNYDEGIWMVIQVRQAQNYCQEHVQICMYNYSVNTFPYNIYKYIYIYVCNPVTGEKLQQASGISQVELRYCSFF